MTRKPPPEHTVAVILQDENENVLLSSGRKSAGKKPDDDSIFIIAHIEDSDDIKLSLQIREAEDFLELALPLVSDARERPFSGSLSASTVDGTWGSRFTISVENHEDYIAHVTMVSAVENHHGASFDTSRTSLERFLHAVRDGLCSNVDDEDGR